MTIQIKHQVIFLTEKQTNHSSKEKKLSLFGITKLLSASCLAEFDSKLAIHEKNVNQGQNYIKQAFVIVTPKSAAGLIRKSKLSSEFLFKRLFLLGRMLQCQGISIDELQNSIIVQENSQTNLVKQMNIIEQSLLNEKEKSPFLQKICSVKPAVPKPLTVADVQKSLDESAFLQNLHMSNSMRLKLFNGSEKLNQTALNHSYHSFVPFAATNDNIVSQSMVCFTKKQTKKQDVIQIGSKNILDELKKDEQEEERLTEQINDKKQSDKKIFTKGSKQQAQIVISKNKEEDNGGIKQKIQEKEMMQQNSGQVDKKMKQMSAQIQQLKQTIQILSKQQATNAGSPGTSETKVENKKQSTEIKKSVVQSPMKASENEPRQVQILSKNEQPKIEIVTSLKTIESICQLQPIQNQVAQSNLLTIQSCNDASDKELKATKATIEDYIEKRKYQNEPPIIFMQKKTRNFEQTEKIRLLVKRKQKLQKYRKMQAKNKKKGDLMLEYVSKQHWQENTNGKELDNREMKTCISSKQNKGLEVENYKNLQIIWADSNGSNAFVSNTLKKEFGQRVKLTKFKEVCFEMIEKIDASLDTKFILICNNSTFLQVLRTTSYPYRNCEHLLVYCMRQEYAYENKHKFGCYQNIQITSCPQEIISMVSQTVRSQYQKIKSRLQ